MFPCHLNCSSCTLSPAARQQCRTESFPHKKFDKHVNRKCFAFELPSATTSYTNFEYYEFRMRRHRRRTACRVCVAIESAPMCMWASEKGNKCVPNPHTAFIYHMLNSHNKVYLCASQPASQPSSQPGTTKNKPQVMEQKLLIVFC